MTLTNKQQFVICQLVNAEPSYIPENETKEERKYREDLIADADAKEKQYGIRPIFEIPIDPWDDDDIDEDEEGEDEEIPSLEKCLTHYKAKDLETLTYCELKEFRKFAIWSGEKELPKKLLDRMRYLVKTKQVTDQEMEASAYL